jgi:hypothetical protein
VGLIYYITEYALVDNKIIEKAEELEAEFELRLHPASRNDAV